MIELAYGEEREYLRPNFFVNTPDILSEYLQHGGRPAFEARLVLAATLSPSYGVYSGFEHFENVAVREGSEEYLHSEKYEIKERRLDGPLLAMIERVNIIRRENRALHELSNITFLDCANDALIAYFKRTEENALITVVNVDPRNTQVGLLRIPPDLGLPGDFDVVDLLDGDAYSWRTGENYVSTRARHARGARDARAAAMTAQTHWFESDPLWFKRAVFYEIHLRGFSDGNADGIG